MEITHPTTGDSQISQRLKFHRKAQELDSLSRALSAPFDISDLLREPADDADAEHMAAALDSFAKLCKEAFEAHAQTPSVPLTPQNVAKTHSNNRERMLQAAIFSHLGEGMLVIDAAQKIFLINERARALLGFGTKEKLTGLGFAGRFHLKNRNNETVPEERNPVCIALTTGETVRIMLGDDLYLSRKDGTSFPVMLTASPIIFNRKLQGIAITFEDITHEKKMDEIKSDFIYIASHQLRTPLTVSTLHTEMLLAGHCGDLTPDQKEFVNEIHFYNKKMAQLLTVFMTVSKIELGTFAMQERPTDLRLVMEDVLHELNTQIKNKHLVVAEKFEDLPMVETDPEFIRIVFQNLISNAIKYTPHEGEITVSLSSGQNGIAVKVADTGCGIPPAEQSQVFTKLYRGSNTQNHRWESNGLGLYITKAIVDKTGGSITFHSETGKGTTFNISLPLKKSEASG